MSSFNNCTKSERFQISLYSRWISQLFVVWLNILSFLHVMSSEHWIHVTIAWDPLSEKFISAIYLLHVHLVGRLLRCSCALVNYFGSSSGSAEWSFNRGSARAVVALCPVGLNLSAEIAILVFRVEIFNLTTALHLQRNQFQSERLSSTWALAKC